MFLLLLTLFFSPFEATASTPDFQTIFETVYCSDDYCGDVVRSSSKSLDLWFSKAGLAAIYDTVKKDYSHFDRENPGPNISALYKGKYTAAFVHADYPNLILKIVDEGQANERISTAELARRAVVDNHLQYIHIPRSAKILLEGIIDKYQGQMYLLIEEKVEAVAHGYGAPDDIWNKLVYQADNGNLELRTKIDAIVGELEVFILKTGYWDIGFTNTLLRSDGQGVSLVDFQWKNQYSPDDGIRRLCEFMARAETIPGIMERAAKELKTTAHELSTHYWSVGTVEWRVEDRKKRIAKAVEVQ